MRKILVILFLFQNPVCIFSQTITGTIENINGERVPFANVVVKDSLNAVNIKEFSIVRNGIYSVTLTKPYQQVVLEVSAGNYQKGIFIIDSFKPAKNYTHNFTLIKDSVIKLKDVVVTAKARPFQVNGDTASYTVSAYRDGTERKIQDVIKKLPGIEVNEKTGEIKYKGKSVETVKLDGEDLFASNYSIGTKNINVDMVEQVQAIENYSANPLLKGIESGDKVALNLVLKKKKADYSGSIDAGAGVLGSKPAIDASLNLLGISKKYKSFATASYNNVGINNTPFDYFSYNPNVEQLKEEHLLAKKYIPDTYLNPGIDATRTNINNTFFGSYNAVFKVGKRASIKSNLYYLNDKLTGQQINISANNINGQQLITSDSYSIIKRPTQLRGDVEIKYNTSKKSLLEYAVQVKKEKIQSANEIIQNDITHINTTLSSRDVYFKQAITYTTRLSSKKALQFNVKHTFNTTPQYLLFSPAILEPLSYHANEQESWFKKSSLLLQSTVLGNTSKGNYTLALGASLKDITFSSGMVGINGNNNTLVKGFENRFSYNHKSIFLSGNYKFQLKRFRLTPALTLSSLHQQLINSLSNTIKDTSSFLIEPGMSLGYKVNNFSAFLISAALKQKPFTEEYLVDNPVYISNRLYKENQVGLQIQRSRNVSLFYFINNLYKQFQLNIGVNFAQHNGNYFSSLVINQNSTKSTYFFLPEKNSFYSLNFMVEKYIPLLQGTIRVKSDYSKQFYKNIINGSLLRNNTVVNSSSLLFFKTAFDGKINFENTIEYRVFKSGAEGSFQFNNQSINANFSIITRPGKRLFFIFSTDYYYLPGTIKNRQTYCFFDTDLTYQSKSKLYDFRFKTRNISNNETFNQLDINDYSTNSFQTKLLPRHLVLSISRSF